MVQQYTWLTFNCMFYQTSVSAAIPNGIHSNVGMGGSSIFPSSMNKMQHSNMNGKFNGNNLKNGLHRKSDNDFSGPHFSSSEETNSRYNKEWLLNLRVCQLFRKKFKTVSVIVEMFLIIILTFHSYTVVIQWSRRQEMGAMTWCSSR